MIANDLIATYTISSSIPVMIDPERTRQVLFNLMKNACKFNRSGGDVCVRADVTSSSLRISVKDSGVGMADMVAERISETNFFYQGDNSRTKRFGGIGLGLAITCKLVKAMGGSLDINSDEGGTMVTVNIPVRQTETGKGSVDACNQSASDGLETRKSLACVRDTVCLVDIDHEGIASQVRNTLVRVSPNCCLLDPYRSSVPVFA